MRKFLVLFSIFVLVVAGLVFTSLKSSYEYIKLPHQPWMEKQVKHDLKKFKKGVDPESLKLAKSLIDEGKLNNLYILTITRTGVENHPRRLTKRSKMIVDYLNNMIKAGANLPNISFLLGDRDAWDDLSGLPKSTIKQLPPIFVFAANHKSKFRQYYVLFPDDHTLGNHLIGYRKGWSKIYNEILAKQTKYPWGTKENIAYWRGLPTDADHYEEGKSPRTLLVKLSKKYLQDIDAAFTETSFANGFILKTFRPLMQILSIPPYVSYEKQLKYKILPNLDGHTCTYPGLLWRLLSKSIVIKQETNNEQWFYHLTKPWIHYVPVEENLEDLIDKVRWIKTHDTEAHKITENAYNLVQTSLTPSHIDAYIVYVLQEYAKLIKGQ